MDRAAVLVRNSGVSTQAPSRQATRPGHPPGAAVLVDVVVLSADARLYEAIRSSIGERNAAWRANSAEESVDLLMTGRCGVLVVDLGAVSTDPSTLIEQVIAQFPDVVVVVAGRRDDESLVAPLISDGRVYRFMHKPLSARRAGMFLGASVRQHLERREHRAPESARPSVARLQSSVESRTWRLAAAALGLLVALIAILVGSLGREVSRQTTTAVERSVSAPTGATPQADPVLSRARAALAGGRYESPAGRNALDLYAAVLLARPGHPEARAGLDDTIARIVARADRAAAAGREAEARRLLKRLQAVAPRSTTVAALASRLDPPAPQLESPVAAVPARLAAPTPAPMPAAASPLPPVTAPRSRPAPSSPSPVRVARPPLPTRMPAKAAVTPTAVITSDPLTPRIANAEEVRKQQEFRERVRLAAARGPSVSSSGATGPPPPRHTTAGYETEAAVKSAAAPIISPGVPDAGGGVSPLPAEEFQPLHVTNPVYPPHALRNGVEGWVELEFTITEQGLVRDVEVLGAEPRGVFESAATTAVGTWRFKPRLANGRPVAQRSVVTLRFNVDR